MPKSRTRSEAISHPLDKNGFIPLYFQIQRALMEKIQSGELSEGDPLASEEELSRHYQVSRMTARQALHGLKTSGYAFSEKGRGTFVTRPKLEKNIMHLQGFTEDMRQRGMKPSSKLLEQTVIAANEDLVQRLKLNADDKILHLRRLRLADGIPMAIEDSHIPLKQFPGLDRIDFAKHSLYQTLRERYGVRVGYADEVIEALPATKEEAELLTIPRKASILSITRIIMTTQETPVEAACSRYRGDRYRASIRVPMTAIE
ncbi:MAG TPA: GntR family transcriptional regulator [Alloacidobacterium sp.]|nr:GntR family transcriptional regulator [Alloacidobacterium sp.]